MTSWKAAKVEENMVRFNQYQNDSMTSSSGLGTFLGSPFVEIEELKDGMYAVVGIPNDVTSDSRPGARLGPKAIREASNQFEYYLKSYDDRELIDVAKGEVFRYPPKLNLVDVGDLNIYPTNSEKTIRSVSNGIYEITHKRAFPIILGGDHFITYPTFKGFSKAVIEDGRAKKVGYIQIDHHFDFGDEAMFYGKYYHGTTAKRVSDLEFLDFPAMCFIGVGGKTSWKRWRLLKKLGAHIWTTTDIAKDGIVTIVRKATDSIMKNCDLAYLTIDIDVVDCSYAPAIVFGGLSHLELLECTKELSAYPIGAIDLVEVAPKYDPTERTQRLATMAILNFILRWTPISVKNI